MISVPKSISQAGLYGHSVKREYSFLFAHSMLHLLGYDHMEPDQARVMEEKQEKEWEEMLRAEYQAAGVTMSGKNYYYQGQLVNVFLDTRANQSFYTLNMNPAGTVNIKIIRDADDKITGAAYLTETEVTELLGDWS